MDGPLTNGGTLGPSSGTLHVRGDLTNTGTVVPGTSITPFSGAADQVLAPGGAALYQVVVNKPTAGANTPRLAGDLTVARRPEPEQRAGEHPGRQRHRVYPASAPSAFRKKGAAKQIG